MITMVIDGRKPLFGNIVGHASGQQWTNNAPHIMLSDLGQRVLEDEVPKINRIYPEVEVWRVALMPDHIHLLLWVSQRLPKSKHLGMVIRGFKTGCSRAWWQLQDEVTLSGKAPSTTTAVPKASPNSAAVPNSLFLQQYRCWHIVIVATVKLRLLLIDGPHHLAGKGHITIVRGAWAGTVCCSQCQPPS